MDRRAALPWLFVDDVVNYSTSYVYVHGPKRLQAGRELGVHVGPTRLQAVQCACNIVCVAWVCASALRGLQVDRRAVSTWLFLHDVVNYFAVYAIAGGP